MNPSREILTTIPRSWCLGPILKMETRCSLLFLLSFSSLFSSLLSPSLSLSLSLYLSPLLSSPLLSSPKNKQIKVNMQPAYDVLNTAIRGVDPSRLIFFAGMTWDDAGAGFSQPPGGQDFANRSWLHVDYEDENSKKHPAEATKAFFCQVCFGLPLLRAPTIWSAFFICLAFIFMCCLDVPAQFESQLSAARRLKSGSMLTETCDPTCAGGAVGGKEKTKFFVCVGLFGRPGGVADGADRFLQSWATWEWKTFCRESNQTNHSTSQNGVTLQSLSLSLSHLSLSHLSLSLSPISLFSYVDM